MSSEWENRLKAATHEKLKHTMMHREEIVSAFVAKHGCQPEDAIAIVTENFGGSSFYIRKREPHETFAVPDPDNPRICRTCNFFDNDEEYGLRDAGDEGLCKRYPPATDSPGSRSPVVAWPITRIGQWCGEWKKKEPR
jgi:hypothetical protein